MHALVGVLFLALIALAYIALSGLLFLSADVRKTARTRARVPGLYLWFLCSISAFVFVLPLAVLIQGFFLALNFTDGQFAMPVYTLVVCLGMSICGFSARKAMRILEDKFLSKLCNRKLTLILVSIIAFVLLAGLILSAGIT